MRSPGLNDQAKTGLCWSILEFIRNDAAMLGEFGHDLLVQPDVHLG
jgi:hypothetical protein